MQNLRMKVKISKELFGNLTKVFTTDINIVEQKVTKTVENPECTSVNSTETTFMPSFTKDSETIDFSVDNCDTQNLTNSITEIEKYTYYSFGKNTSVGYKEIIANKFIKKSLSKSAIKQFLLYCFLPHNKSFVRKGIPYSQIAKYCNISVPAVKENHAVLQQLGFIYSTPAGRGKVDILIPDEHKLHLKKKEGNKGYLTMSVDMLENLLQYNSINDLRVELEKIRRADAKKGKMQLIHFNKQELIKVLPDYIRKSKNLLNRALNSNKTLFPIINNKIDITNYEHQKTIDNRLKEQIKGIIESLFENSGYSYCHEYTKLSNRRDYLSMAGYNSEVKQIQSTLEQTKAFIIDELCNLGLSYGLNNIVKAIMYMFDSNCFYDSYSESSINLVKNTGGFIRSVLNTNISVNGSLNVSFI